MEGLRVREERKQHNRAVNATLGSGMLSLCIIATLGSFEVRSAIMSAPAPA
jgi:hypothetical protein